ncbi:MAG: membrane dipeptidase, partial [Myxococcota bacterium]
IHHRGDRSTFVADAVFCGAMWFLLASCSSSPPSDPPSPSEASAGAASPAPATPPPPAWAADLHVDTLTELGDRDTTFADPALEAGIPALTAGGTTVIVNVLWPPRDGDHEPYTFAQLDRFEQQLRLAPVAERMALARTPAEADAIVASGRIATLLALEGAHGIEVSGVEGLGRLHDRGLSMLGLAWSLSNRFAGSSGDGGGGLTPDGAALLAAAQSLGVLIDLSHASRATVLDACAITTAPLVASHSGATAVNDVPRNLSAEEIACIARSDGVIGVNFHAPFVAAGPVGIPQVADQVDALVKAAGIDHVGIGSDWDGDIQAPTGLASAAGLPGLWDELRRRGYDDAGLAKIRGGNFRRVWLAAQRSR